MNLPPRQPPHLLNQNGPRFPTYPAALLLVLVVSLIFGFSCIMQHFGQTPTYTIDSYFYLSKAKQLASGQGLGTTWNDGIDAKYFPGYSIVLAPLFLLREPYIILQLSAYAACGCLLILVGGGAGVDSRGSLLASTALFANPIILKWLSLPMAEGVALMLSLLAVAFFLVFLVRKSSLSLILACAVGGLATLTRIEALFLLIVFGMLVVPERKNVSWPQLIAGLVIFLLPLFWYFLWLRGAAGAESAYIGEFKGTLPTADLLKNLAYNIFVPFGFMHWPVKSLSASELLSVTGLAGVVWIGLGECVFVGGLAAALGGRLGSRLRATAVLFVAYAFLHSFWYYRYERFMLMALPFAAIIWAATVREVCARFMAKRQDLLLLLIQLTIAASGLYLGNLYSTRHQVELQQDTGWLRFESIADVVNSLNNDPRFPVLTDLGPHLAYYIDAHTYFDTEHGNYWKRAFPPERTLDEMEKLGIRFVVTRKDVGQWFEEHAILPEAQRKFKVLQESVEGVSILEYILERGRNQ